MKAKQLWDWAWHGLAGCVLDISLQLQVKFAGDSKGPELSRGKLYSSFSFAYHLFSSACLALVSSAQAGAHVLDTTVCVLRCVSECTKPLTGKQVYVFRLIHSFSKQPHLFACSSTAWQSLLIFFRAYFTSFCIHWQNMALGDTNRGLD